MAVAVRGDTLGTGPDLQIDEALVRLGIDQRGKPEIAISDNQRPLSGS